MISHLLDTNAVITLIGRRSDTLVSRVLGSVPGTIGLSSIVAHELYFGAHKSAKIEHNLETLRLLLADFPVLDFDQRDAYVAGEIRATLAAKGTPIGPYDALIAGQAKARDLVVVTNNTGEFARVEGLRVEDWTR
ncbi:type II toxin-antitoxin system VapC family toxin [Ochrobactrum soli]|uniref:Ribonuclease VapC n=1 Tax=Ochrobactrum soli TaxID=2448455 RepID=A0A849KXS5_9HYPH|nr:type II toxin-antitoxin system VapC family toxin [[Ochrobactrum] soli]MCI0999310.1 type II toxin-antitoxin system VapC family toxin [Ochrobactrum sp. C6C9]NNU60842.1 type II toxin-antitoxin system VapC family toxin [[Ochrobactrum] soli]RLL71995.1 type II toxin-antitoxin system VapC family toxin [[Ochrobactrum] soli]